MFDLALLDLKTFVEFDGGYHEEVYQKEVDAKKDLEAKEFGWEVVRVPVKANQIIEPSKIYHIFK